MTGDRHRHFTFLALALFIGTGCKDSTGPDDPGVIGGGVIFATSQPSSRLYRVPIEPDDTDVLIGEVRTTAGVNLFITDIAVAPNGGLWGVTFGELYRIDAATAVATRVGPLGVGDMNALTFAPDGRLLGAGAGGNFAVIDTITGIATRVGAFGAALFSAGDLAYGPDGTLYATIIGGASGDLLATVNPATGVATLITVPPNSIGFPAVWGIDFVEGQLYGLTAFGPTAGTGVLIRIDPSTGAGTHVRDISVAAGGATRPRNPVLR